jgi:hypothetical protein
MEMGHVSKYKTQTHQELSVTYLINMVLALWTLSVGHNALNSDYWKKQWLNISLAGNFWQIYGIMAN